MQNDAGGGEGGYWYTVPVVTVFREKIGFGTMPHPLEGESSIHRCVSGIPWEDIRDETHCDILFHPDLYP